MTSTRSGMPHPMPFVRIELAVLGVADGALQVLLGRRESEPHKGRWALPGGVLRIDQDADLDAACARVAQERLGTKLAGGAQLCAVGRRNRDPRAPWALSIVYRCTTTPDALPAQPGKRLTDLKWVDAPAAAADDELAFDHRWLVDRAMQALRLEVRELRFPPGLITAPFTLSDLQATAEAVLGQRLDKSSFRRRLSAVRCVEPIPGASRTGAFRPARLYHLGCLRSSSD